ncbi:MAG: DUF934 domain-containing protein [Gammaproteobacteria bacterium]|nr:DUF934 domain-containing protein [Gammaproteobacteria bacterium]
MPPLISHNKLIEDDWRPIGDDQIIGDGEKVIISLARLRQQWDALARMHLTLAVELEPTAAVDLLVPFLDHLEMVVLHFDTFTDGRAFSQARLLRGRHLFSGDIRAVGDVLCDQLSFMRRCGFNQFQLAVDQDIDLAFRLFADISRHYQRAWKLPVSA